jgi:hypothetical protein
VSCGPLESDRPRPSPQRSPIPYDEDLASLRQQEGGPVTSDHQDHDGIPLPTGPLEESGGGEVVDLRPTAGRARRPALPAAELAISSYGEVAARVQAAWSPTGSSKASGQPTPTASWPPRRKPARPGPPSTSPSPSPPAGPGWTTSPAQPPAPCWSSSAKEGSGPRCAASRPSPPPKASTQISSATNSDSASASRGWPPPAPAASWPPSRPSWPPTRRRWSSWTRCIWPRPGPAAPICTTWGPSSRPIQGVCQQAGCALLAVTHWNRTGDGRGADRISGARPPGPGSSAQSPSTTGAATRMEPAWSCLGWS